MASLRSRYELRWEVLDVIIAGRSSIDAPTGFHIQNTSEADRFISSYGYDWENPIEKL